MDDELQKRLAKANNKLTELTLLGNQFITQLNNNSQQIKVVRTKVASNLERLNHLQQDLNDLEQRNTDESIDSGIASGISLSIDDHMQLIKQMQDKFIDIQKKLDCLEKEVKRVDDAYHHQFVKDNMLSYVESIISLKDPVSDETLQIEHLEELADQHTIAIDDEDLCEQAITVIDKAEGILSQYYSAYIPLKAMIQTLTTKIALVSIDFQKNIKDGLDLEKDLASLQTTFSAAPHRFNEQ